jgi:manganese/iron transport system permease protein
MLPAPFDAPYMERALVEMALLSVLAGVLGGWVVLRRLAFFTHAAGTATFPGLVAASAWGIAAPLAALACALGFAGTLEAATRARRTDPAAATGLLLVGALALGALLASDVFEASANVDTLLFGSLVTVRWSDVALTAAVVVAVLMLEAALRRAWLASTFEPGSARSLGAGGRGAQAVLPAAIAAAVVVALDAVGALLVGVILVLPAATARLLTNELRAMRRLAGGLALAQGVVALWIAQLLDASPGPVLAVLGGATFAGVSVAGRRRA